MAEIHDQIIETLSSDAFAQAVQRLTEENATALGGVVMRVVHGQPIQSAEQSTGPRVLSEEEFLKLSPDQLKRLEQYDEYVARKAAKFAEANQASGMAAEMAAASKRLDDMRDQQRQTWQHRQQVREKWMDRLICQSVGAK